MEAILILDDFDNSFHYFPEPTSPCLLPIGDNILIENLITWIKRTCVYSLTLVTSSSAIFSDFQQYLATINSSLKIHIIEIDKQSNCLGDFIRNISISLNLQNDFLLIYGNTYLCHDLDVPIKQHIDLKVKRPNLEATILLSKILPNESLRANNEQNIYITSTEGRILCYANLNADTKFGLGYEQLKKYKLGENYSLKLNYDLVNSGIIICTNKIVEKFKTSFDFKTIDDYILHVTNDELEYGEIFTYVLDKPIGSDCHTLSIADYNIYYQLFKLIPFTLDKFAKYNILSQLNGLTAEINGEIDDSTVKECKLSSTSTIISSWVYNCLIADNCHISNSVIFNSEIKSNVVISNCLVLGNCIFKQNTKISGIIVGSPFKVTDVQETEQNNPLAHFSLIGNRVDLRPPSIYSSIESSVSNNSLPSKVSNDYDDSMHHNTQGVRGTEDITEFEDEVFDMISDILTNPKYIQYSVLELKGLRLAYNVQNVHMIQALLYPIVNWLCTNYPDQSYWDKALDEAKICTIFAPFIEEEDKMAHFSAFSALLRVCNNENFERNSLRFCYVCEAFNSANLLNFDFLPEWYNELGGEEKVNSSLIEVRFKAFLEWLDEE